MVQVANVSKSYAHQEIVNNISFTIHKGEKVGLVGRNGYGKTTLFRMLTGLELPESGTILFPKSYSIAYLQQEISFTHSTILEEVLSAIPKDEIAENWKAEKILFGLDFSREMTMQNPNILSGGWMNRINLAKVLISNADMLLLDEPTNHLDIITIHWLINFLKSWRKELILITHDRVFMDSIVDHIMGIHRKQIRKIKGTSEKLYEQIATEEEIYEKTRQNDAKEKARVELFISRFRAKARLGGLVQSRIKSLSKKDNKNALETIQDIEFQFNYKPFEAKTMINVQDLSFGYDPNTLLIKDLSFYISKGDHIAIIGKNGKGKSTLLRLLCNQLNPINGSIKAHPQLLSGYYGQVAEQELHPQLTIEEEIASVLPHGSKNTARSIAGAMLFEGSLALKKCGILSGGEKARVLLGKLIAQPTQCLFLDEPSNHLDMQSVDSLIEALNYFEGGSIFVTHNEMLLYSLATRLVVFDQEYPYIFEGTYKEFLEDKGFTDDIIIKESTKSMKLSKKEERKERTKLLKELKEQTKPLEDKIKELDNTIQEQESCVKDIHKELITATTNNQGNIIAELGKELAIKNKEIEQKYEELLQFTQELENFLANINT